MNKVTIKFRLKIEKEQGKYIARKGERVWNWSSVAGKIRCKRRSEMFVTFIGNKSKKILEVGCGTGIFTEAIAKTKNTIYAIDISNELLLLAKKRIKVKNVFFKIADAHKTNFRNRFFDFIVGSSVLHHLEVGRSLKEFYRILNFGGKMIFTEPNMLNPQVALERNIPFIGKLASNSVSETAFIRWRLKRQLKEVGFKNIKIRPFDFLHPATPIAMINFVNVIGKKIESFPFIKEISGSLKITAEK